MIPMRNSTIFKSRWMALLWAGGIIWFALHVGAPDDKPVTTAANPINRRTGKLSTAFSSDVRQIGTTRSCL